MTEGKKHGGLSYRDAGVDIEKAREAMKRIKSLVKKTYNENVLQGHGAFGGSYSLSGLNLREPVLVSSSDGVGTKLKVAFALNIHDTVGRDLVNHCVNDIMVMGARPLFFMDYIGTGKLRPGVIESLVKGLSEACIENRVALLGGETAELPGLYSEDEYDLAGFIVGVCDKASMPDASAVKPGDALVGIASSGLHTNGYSLALKALLDVGGMALSGRAEELGTTLGEELLRVHKSYLKPIEALRQSINIKAMAHITGGSFEENLPRILPKNCNAEIKKGSWEVPPIFPLIMRKGNVSEDEMFRTFNMGIGIVLVLPKEDSGPAIEILRKEGEKAWIIGKVAEGAGKVVFL